VRPQFAAVGKNRGRNPGGGSLVSALQREHTQLDGLFLGIVRQGEAQLLHEPEHAFVLREETSSTAGSGVWKVWMLASFSSRRDSRINSSPIQHVVRFVGISCRLDDRVCFATGSSHMKRVVFTLGNFERKTRSAPVCIET
jgi:hypothetical protein